MNATGEDRITEKAPPMRTLDTGTAKDYSRQGQQRMLLSPTPPNKQTNAKHIIFKLLKARNKEKILEE